jgi:hypothetical protein
MSSLLGKGMATKIEVYAFSIVSHMEVKLDIFLPFVVSHGHEDIELSNY